MEKNNDEHVHVLHDGHTCPPGHCCQCSGCGPWGGYSRRRYMGHVLVLVLGVVMAFYIGMKLGEFKGYFMSTGYMPMHGYQGWVMPQRGWGYRASPSTSPVSSTPTVTPAAPSSSTPSPR